MAHRTSAAALHSARVVMKEYTLTPRPSEELTSGAIPSIKASEAHAAILIDYATNVFEVALLRPELHYWQKRLSSQTAEASKIADFLGRLLGAFSKIPRDSSSEQKITSVLEVPSEFGYSKPEVIVITKPAREASRYLFYYYDLCPSNRTPDAVLDRAYVARLVEVSLGLSRTSEALPMIRRTHEELKSGSVSVNDVRRRMRQIGIIFEYLPNYENREEETKLLT